MHSVSQTGKKVSCLLKIIVIISAAAGIIMSADAGREVFMGGSRVFMYFTIQSNILIALICAIGLCFLLRDRAAGIAWYIIKFVGTVSITLTGIVFTFVLAPVFGPPAWNVQNVLTHVVVPLAAVADFFVTASGAGIKRRSVIWVVIPPMLYVMYAGIGYVNGWEFAKGQTYPYFFLNWGSPAGAFGFTDKLPYMGCVWWILVLLAFLIAVGWCYLSAADRIGRAAAGKAVLKP